MAFPGLTSFSVNPRVCQYGTARVMNCWISDSEGSAFMALSTVSLMHIRYAATRDGDGKASRVNLDSMITTRYETESKISHVDRVWTLLSNSYVGKIVTLMVCLTLS